MHPGYGVTIAILDWLYPTLSNQDPSKVNKICPQSDPDLAAPLPPAHSITDPLSWGTERKAPERYSYCATVNFASSSWHLFLVQCLQLQTPSLSRKLLWVKTTQVDIIYGEWKGFMNRKPSLHDGSSNPKLMFILYLMHILEKWKSVCPHPLYSPSPRANS